jgi:hypothetical protein
LSDPIRFPPLALFDSRDSTGYTDARLFNGYVGKDTYDDYWIHRRPALQYLSSSPERSLIGAGKGLGIYFWQRYNKLFLLWGGNVYWAQPGGAWATPGTVIDDGTGVPYRFNETQGSTPALFLKTATNAYYFQSPSTITKVTDINYPAVTVPGSAYLDGTTYVMDTAGVIWGSKNLNDVAVWDALNRIVAQAEPDLGVAIAKQATYVVAFKQWSTEFFYDAAVSPGSPLLPMQNAKISMGCLSAASVRSVNDVLYFIGTNRTSSAAVYEIRGLKLRKISTEAVDRFLNAASPQISALKSWTARINGRDYYCFSSLFTVGQSYGNRSAIFDITSELWYFWNANDLAFDIVAGAADTSGNLYLQQGTSGGILYNFVERAQSDNLYTSTGLDTLTFTTTNAIQMDIICPTYDGGTRLKKVLNKMRLVADRTNGTKLYVRWSDDDYRNWSGWRIVDLGDPSPQLTNLGTFRKRAFQFQYRDAANVRIKAAELEMSLGSF